MIISHYCRYMQHSVYDRVVITANALCCLCFFILSFYNVFCLSSFAFSNFLSVISIILPSIYVNLDCNKQIFWSVEVFKIKSNVIKCEKCSSQFPRAQLDVCRSLVTSKHQSKTQRIFIFGHKYVTVAPLRGQLYLLVSPTTISIIHCKHSFSCHRLCF